MPVLVEGIFVIRTIIYAVMMFVTIFVGGLWIARGFPMYIPSPVSVRPVQPTFGDNSAAKHREQLAEEQLRDPENAKRDPLRADALQAATGFALSPCDSTMKTNLVAAVQAYAAALHDTLKCSRIFTDCAAAFDKASAVYSTAYDMRVTKALHEAFEKGGISAVDFPPELRRSVTILASSQGNPISACDPSLRRQPVCPTLPPPRFGRTTACALPRYGSQAGRNWD
jgi:hypothetical protein